MAHDMSEQLNKEQLKAVSASPDKALKIIAGPGTGKTFTMVKRFLALSKIFSPGQILALTFTNKAAEEMLLRLEAEGLKRQNLWVSTFHSFATRLLRESPFIVDLDAGFRIIEENEQELLLRRSLAKLRVENRNLLEEIENLNPDLLDNLWDDLPRIIKRIKMHLLPPGDLTKSLKALSQKIFHGEALTDEESSMEKVTAELVEAYYWLYQRELMQNNVLDFSDLLIKLYNLLQNESYREGLHKRFRYILVDEFQDTNIAQFKILKLLAQPDMSNVSIVGDDKQSIYGFRDADMANLTKRFPPAQEVLLKVNYRSFQPILDISTQLLGKGSPGRIEEINAHHGKGEDISIAFFVAESEEEEAEFIARKIRKLAGKPLRTKNKLLGRKEGDAINYGDFAVLMRAMRGRKAVQLLEDALTRWQIPYRIIGGAAFLGSQEAIDILNYLKVIDNPLDGLSMIAVLSNPCLALSDNQFYLLKQQHIGSDLYDDSLYACLAFAEELQSVLPAETISRLAEFYSFLNRMLSIKDSISLASLVSSVIEGSGYLRYAKGDESYRSQMRLANLQRLHRLAKDFDDRQVFCCLRDFIDYVDMIQELGLDERDIELAPAEEAVSLMTIHKAKGLEFPLVFMTGFPPRKQKKRQYKKIYFDEKYGLLLKGEKGEESGKFQHFVQNNDPRQKEIEEEERVKYVGLTRAQELLVLTAIDPDNPDISWVRDFCSKNHPLAQEVDMPEAPAIQKTSVSIAKKPLTEREREIILPRLKKLVALEKGSIPLSEEVSQLSLSYSQLAVYLNCPLQYYFVYILKLPRPEELFQETPSLTQKDLYGGLNIQGLSYGSLIHRVLSWFHRSPSLAAPEERLHRLREIMKMLLAEKDKGKHFPAPVDKVLRVYAYHPYSEIHPAYIDREFNLKLGMPGGAYINLGGFIDRIDKINSTWKIIDYKTDAELTPGKLEAYRFQLLSYLLAFNRGALLPHIRLEDAVEIEILHVQKGEVIPLPYSDSDLSDTEKKIIRLAHRIITRDFAIKEEHKNRDCRSCSFGGDVGFCPYNRCKIEKGEES
jgi:DNA helicase-2/ATP-dependent DNA helicase PcrA